MQAFPAEESSRRDDEENVPEPEDEIDLLIENVDGENTLSVMSLNVTTGTVLVKGALGHSGKHF